MPDTSQEALEEILQTLYNYRFQALAAHDEPLEKLVKKDRLAQPEKASYANNRSSRRLIDYQSIMEEISKVIYDYLKKRPDDQYEIYQLIQAKIKDPKDKEKTLPLESYLNSHKLSVLLDGKTLRRLLRGESTSRITINIIKAFHKVVTKEQEELGQLNYILGDYNLYNFDSVERQQFQISNFRLRSGGKSKLTYCSNREEQEQEQVRLELVGMDKLLIHFVMDDCRMFFYAHIGRSIAADVIQLVYLYNNRHGQPVASLAVMRRVPEKELEVPRRGQKSTGNTAIDRYLKHRAAMLTAQPGKNRFQQFDESDLAVEPGPFRRDARHYENLRKRKGLYRIYFCERYPSHDQYVPNQFYSTVGRGYLLIFEDAFGRLCAKMKTRQDRSDKLLRHNGWVFNDLLQDGNYMVLQLYRAPNHGRAVNLFLLLKGPNIVYGSHNIMYDALGKIGSGAVLLRRELAEGDKHSADKVAQAFEKAKPEVLLPTDTGLSPGEQRIVSYLSALPEAHVSPVTDHDHFKERYSPIVHIGTYKMYSYGKGGIRMGILRIFPSGFVEHKSVGGAQKELLYAYGKAQLVRQSLYLQLENRDNGRLGFCVFKTEGEVPPEVGKTIFTGTFCGVTRRNGEFPLASRLILEAVSDNPDQKGFEPLYLKYTDEQFEKLPAAVRQALKGRAESMVGFFKNKVNILTFNGLKYFNKQEADLGEALVRAAVYERLHSTAAEDSRKVELLLEKAERYGERTARSHYKEQLALEIPVLYERAAYQLIVKGDKKACLQHLQHARELAGQPLNLLPFEQAIGERQELFELKKMDAYRRLWG